MPHLSLGKHSPPSPFPAQKKKAPLFKRGEPGSCASYSLLNWNVQTSTTRRPQPCVCACICVCMCVHVQWCEPLLCLSSKLEHRWLFMHAQIWDAHMQKYRVGEWRCASVGQSGDKEGSNDCTVPSSWTTKCDATYLLWPVLRKWGNEVLSLSTDMTDILRHFSSLTWTGVRSPRAVTLGLRTGDVNVLAASSSRGDSLDPGP